MTSSDDALHSTPRVGRGLAPLDGKNLAPKVKEFVQHLRELRERAGLSSNRLEAELDMPAGGLSRYLSGERLPQPEWLRCFQDWVAENTEVGLTEKERKAGRDLYYAAAWVKNPVIANKIEIENLSNLWAERIAELEHNIKDFEGQLTAERSKHEQNTSKIDDLEERLNQSQTAATLLQKQRVEFITMAAKSATALILREVAAKAAAANNSETVPALHVSTLNITIYLSDQSIHAQVEEAVEDVVASASGQIDERDEPQLGSWFRTMRARVPNQAAVRVLEHAVDARFVHAQEAAVTSELLKHVGPVISALGQTDNAVIRLGALLIVKADGILTIRQLTAAEQLKLDRQQSVLRSPQDVLSFLESAEETPDSDEKSTEQLAP